MTVEEIPVRGVSGCSTSPFRSCQNRASVNTDEASALVLVVERDPHVRALESYFLNEAGFVVDFASDGVSALELARERHPAIIVTEILVPQLDGLALCREIKHDPQLSATVVLIFSILAAQSRARDAGADAFLLKPLAEQRLVQTVRDLLARRTAASPYTAPGTLQEQRR